MTTEHKRGVKEIPLGFGKKLPLYYHHHRVFTTLWKGGKQRSTNGVLIASGTYLTLHSLLPPDLRKAKSLPLSEYGETPAIVKSSK